jgi:hypothetical protein
MRPHLIKNILAPFTPNAEGVAAMADLDAAVVVESFERPRSDRDAAESPPIIADYASCPGTATANCGVTYHPRAPLPSDDG